MFSSGIKDIDFFTCILIAFVVIMIIYFIRNSVKYSSTLLEGLENNNKKKNNPLDFFDFMTKIEKKDIEMAKSTATNFENIVSTLKSDLKLNECSGSDSYGSLYEDILINLEELCDIAMLTKCLKLSNELTSDKTNAHAKLSLTAVEINQLQKFKENLNNIYTWTKSNTSSMINCS